MLVAQCIPCMCFGDELPQNSDQGERFGSFYFAAWVEHIHPGPGDRSGYMEYLGYSKDLRNGLWHFDTGATTFIDSYRQRSFSIFSNVSSDRFVYGYFRPTVELVCAYKGTSINSNKRAIFIFPLPMVRIGAATGLFADVAAVPPLGSLTSGWVGAEFAYKW